MTRTISILLLSMLCACTAFADDINDGLAICAPHKHYDTSQMKGPVSTWTGKVPIIWDEGYENCANVEAAQAARLADPQNEKNALSDIVSRLKAK